jgi:hypothetical protein
MESHTYMRTIRTTRPIAPALILSLLLGACGGGDGNNGAPGAEGAPGAVGASGPAGATGGDGTPGGKGEQGNLLKWVITDKEVNAEPNTAYLATSNAAEVVVTLPAAAQPGDVVRVEGSGWGGWKIAQNEKQTVKLDAVDVGKSWTAQATDERRRWNVLGTSSDGSKVVAGQSNGFGFFTSTNGGLTWTAHPLSIGTPWRSFAYSGDGTKLVGVAAFGQLLTSTDDGETVEWHSTDPLNPSQTRNWTSVAPSFDGTTLVASTTGTAGLGLGDIYISTDGGATWTPQSQRANWKSVAISHKGDKVVAADFGGTIHTATKVTAQDGTVSWAWTELPGQQTRRNWIAVALSADGSKVVAADAFGFIHIFTDDANGGTWKQVGHNNRWSTVDISADGRVLVAAADSADSLIYTSTDGGDTWSTTWSDSHVWKSVAISDDGYQMFAVENDGYIFTSKAKTTPGVTGSISGTMSDAAELIYLGDGVYSVLDKVGDLKIQ